MHDRTRTTPETTRASMNWKKIIPHVFFLSSIAVVWATNFMVFFTDAFNQLDAIQALLLAVFAIGLANYFKIGLLTDD